MTTWPTIIPVSGTVQRDTMVSALTLYDGLLGEAGAAPVIASAATTDIAAGAAATARFVEISGTAGITSFGTTAANGVRRLLRFQGAATVTHSAALALPGSANITTEAGTLMLAERVTAGWRVLDVRLPSLMTPGSIDVAGSIHTYLQNNRVLIREERTDATHNGGTTAGSWQARGVVLTEVLDPGAHASVSSATFTLAAGVWDMQIEHVFGVSAVSTPIGARGRLWNETAGAAVADSLSATLAMGNFSGFNANVRAPSRCRITLAAPATFRLEYWVANAIATGGLGWHDTIATGVEIYSTIDALKVG